MALLSEAKKTHAPDMTPLATIPHPSGNITVVEKGTPVSFDIRRVYFLHGLSADSQRGSHAHKKLSQLMIAVSGSFQVSLTHADWRKKYVMDDPTQGLLIPPMTWRDLSHFSSGAVCLVLASENYDEADYIRDFDSFVKAGE